MLDHGYSSCFNMQSSVARSSPELLAVLGACWLSGCRPIHTLKVVKLLLPVMTTVFPRRSASILILSRRLFTSIQRLCLERRSETWMLAKKMHLPEDQRIIESARRMIHLCPSRVRFLVNHMVCYKLRLCQLAILQSHSNVFELYMDFRKMLLVLKEVSIIMHLLLVYQN